MKKNVKGPNYVSEDNSTWNIYGTGSQVNRILVFGRDILTRASVSVLCGASISATVTFTY